MTDKKGEAGSGVRPGSPPDTAHRHRRWNQLAAAAVFVACVASAGGGVVAWHQMNDEPPLGAPPPLPPPPRFPSVPVLPSAAAPTLAGSPRALPAPSSDLGHTPNRSEGSAHNPVRPLPVANRPADALGEWARKLRGIDVPPVALRAYGYTQTVLAKVDPGCHLSWTVLAGIGAIESDHGRYGGARLQPDGTSEPPIIGVPVAGIGAARVPDTDRGSLDGSRVLDRAIGPMQFLPATWRLWATDADGDGVANPFDLDDAALAAGYSLCASGDDLATGAGWSAAVFSYNHAPTYVERVYDFADAYGRAT